MDFNGLLMATMLLYGPFDTKQVHRHLWRVLMHQAMVFCQLISCIKLLIIMLYPLWDNETMILLYLIDFYVINSPVQFAFYVGCFGVHFAVYGLYVKWGHLNSDPKRMHHLRMFFTPNIYDLCREFDLDIRLTRRFVRQANVAIRVMNVIATIAMVIFFGLTIRCMNESYIRLPFVHFLFISCPLGILTLYGYIFLTYSFLGTLLMALLTMKFLVLRATCLSEKIERKFGHFTRYAKVGPDTVTLLKQRKQLKKILSTLNDIVEQFKATNDIFDEMISNGYVSCLVGALIFPMFFFLDISNLLKLIMGVLYFIAVGVNCFLISIYNDEFLSKMKVLDTAIHRTMPMYQGFDVKMYLGNYLMLNNEHKRLSFTFWKSFNYSTTNLIKYIMESVSLILMILQAIWSGPATTNGILSVFSKLFSK